MASESLSCNSSAVGTARAKPNNRRADSDATPEAVATEYRTTPRVLRSAGNRIARAKLPAPMQLTLSSPERGERDAVANANGMGIRARLGYSSRTVYAPVFFNSS